MALGVVVVVVLLLLLLVGGRTNFSCENRNFQIGTVSVLGGSSKDSRKKNSSTDTDRDWLGSKKVSLLFNRDTDTDTGRFGLRFSK